MCNRPRPWREAPHPPPHPPCAPQCLEAFLTAIGWARAPEVLQPAKAVAAAVLARVCLGATSFNLALDPGRVAATLTERLACTAVAATAAGTPSAHASGVAALEAVAALAGDERTRSAVGLRG